jgi:hypothetical protein
VTLNEKPGDGAGAGKPNIPESSDKPPLDVSVTMGKASKSRGGRRVFPLFLSGLRTECPHQSPAEVLLQQVCQGSSSSFSLLCLMCKENAEVDTIVTAVGVQPCVVSTVTVIVHNMGKQCTNVGRSFPTDRAYACHSFTSSGVFIYL